MRRANPPISINSGVNLGSRTMSLRLQNEIRIVRFHLVPYKKGCDYNCYTRSTNLKIFRWQSRGVFALYRLLCRGASEVSGPSPGMWISDAAVANCLQVQVYAREELKKIERENRE
jgi:hypothetical protein